MPYTEIEGAESAAHDTLSRTLAGTDTAAANGANTTIATAATADCLINGIIIYADGAQTGDLTELAVKAGPGGVQTLIPVANLPQADLDTDGKAVSVDLGPTGYLLIVGETIVIEHTGTDVTPLSLKFVISYSPVSAGGNLA
tara:strand:- start:54507 stop:54932 length:426 start_codon:yes stop_codon:yes gene_type:complete